MVRNASRAPKIDVHVPFDLNFDVGIGTFYPDKFHQAYVSEDSNFERAPLNMAKGII